MSGNIYGYGAIGTGKNTKTKLINLMMEQGVSRDNIMVESYADSLGDKPELQVLLAIIEQGDLIIINNIKDLGNTYDDIIKTWNYITKMQKADIKVIDTPILDTRTINDLLGAAMTDIVVTLLTYVIENNKEYKEERKRIQSEAIASALENGVHFGRKKRELPDNFFECVRRWRNKEISAVEAATECGMSRSTFYSRVKEIDNKDLPRG